MKESYPNIKEIPTAQFAAITLRLTPKSLEWLNGTTHGIPHLTIYRDLLFSMATSDMTIGKRGIDVPLKPLEVEASANGLGERWNLGRKVMTRLLAEMEQLGLVKISRSKLTSIATMTAVLDYDAIAPTSPNPPSDKSQAGQQNVAQPGLDGGTEATPPVSAEAGCADGTPAPKAAGDPPPQSSAPTEGKASNTSPTSYMSGRQQPGTDVGTLFDGVDEQPESGSERFI